MLPRPWRAYRRARLAFRLFNRARKRWLRKRRAKRAAKRGEVVAEKAEEVEVDTKPWWRSVGVMSGLGVVVGFLLEMAGVAVCPDGTTIEAAEQLACFPVAPMIDQAMELVAGALVLFGGIGGIIGRIRATKKVTL